MECSRRVFLRGIAALGGMAALSDMGALARAVEKASGKVGDLSAEVRHIKTTCVHCVVYCGIDVTVRNGVIQAIYPDAERAPYFNRGICPKGVAGLFNTYNPYRLKRPLRRTNPKKGRNEDPGWVEISWDEAFDTIAERLKKIRAENPAKLVWQDGQGRYLSNTQPLAAFCAAFGTPNFIHRTTLCIASRNIADQLTWGSFTILPDLQHANLLLNFGSTYYEGEQWARWLDYNTALARDRGMKTIVFDPRMSVNAAKADEWVPVRPGSDAVLILAMAKLLIDSGNIDEDFLITYTNAPELVGTDGAVLKDPQGKSLVFDAATKSIKPLADDVKPALKGSFAYNGAAVRTAFQIFIDSLNGVSPEYAENVTGVPASTIRRITDEIARQARIGSTIDLDGQRLRHRPVAVHTFRGLTARQHGVQNWRAGIVLEMLLGGLDAVGGMIVFNPNSTPKTLEPSNAEYPPRRVDLAGSIYFPHATQDVGQQVNLSLLDPKGFGLPYEPEMQLIYGSNRPFSASESARQFEGMKRTYNVVIDIVMTETAWFADIVLPDDTYLEGWHYSMTRWAVDARTMAIRQPVVDNVFKIPYEGLTILWALAKRAGFRDAYAEELNRKWGLKETKFIQGRDYNAREALEIVWTELTKKDFSVALEKGFVGKKLNAADRYLKGVEDKFKGPGKPKMKFYADQLVGSYEKIAGNVKKHGVSNLDLDAYKVAMSPLPLKEHAFPAAHRNRDDYPFYLITHKVMHRNQSGNTCLNPILNALGGTDTNSVAMNRSTAQKMQIKTGDTVVIETKIGKVKGVANVIEGIRPDTVAVSYHYGQWSPGLPDYAKTGIDINSVLELRPDVISG
ncbi:MAG TPA: molybdopterin-dependent oxidoreductase, partial [Dissulfurispiraceae bacterium]|nr:molybdopterin-dependent oxidoreductase [Dissulfurispiraceae bacterium]